MLVLRLVAASSDHAILDRCQKWFNAARAVMVSGLAQARMVDLGGEWPSCESKD